jgi:hypothetical protein
VICSQLPNLLNKMKEIKSILGKNKRV